jgi:hypothetical protein
MNEVLILDKSVFHGTASNKLIKFVKCHRVILPHALCVECAISQKGEPPDDSKDAIRLTQKLLDVIKSGAYAGKSPAKIVEEERSRNAVIESLIDMEQTQIMRESELDDNIDLEAVREECDKMFKSTTDFVKQWAEQYFKTIGKKEKEKDFRDEVDGVDLVGRLTKWLSAVEEKKNEILDLYSSDGRRIVPSDGWEWQLVRLSLVWGTELACNRNKSGPSFENYGLSNDIFDIYYVSHLSQADGLIAGDKKLVRPLAMAAFPDKNVFVSIDEVPIEYRKSE